MRTADLSGTMRKRAMPYILRNRRYARHVRKRDHDEAEGEQDEQATTTTAT